MYFFNNVYENYAVGVTCASFIITLSLTMAEFYVCKFLGWEEHIHHSLSGFDLLYCT